MYRNPNTLTSNARMGRVLYWPVQGNLDDRIAEGIRRCGLEVHTASSLAGAQDALAASSIDVVVADTDGPDALLETELPAANEAVTNLLRSMVRIGQPVQLLALRPSALRSAEVSDDPPWEAFAEFFAGAFERPRTHQGLKSLLLSAIDRARSIQDKRLLRWQLASRSLRDLLGDSRPIRELLEEARRAADTGHHTTICGETGTGRGLLAQAIHENGPYASGQFIRLNCRLLASRTLEQELFGLRRRTPGVGHDGDGGEDTACGTLVLEDAEFLSLSIQSRLRRHLTRSPSRIFLAGLNRVRVVATTLDESWNRHGEDRPSDPELRSELCRIVLRVPSLREHPEDIPLLARQFLTNWSFREGRPGRQLTHDALELLKQYSWPGNVQELHRVLGQSSGLESGNILSAAAITPWLAKGPGEPQNRELGLSLREMERRLIETTFARCGGNREQTARTLQIGIRTLSGKLREYGYPPRGGPHSNRKAA